MSKLAEIKKQLQDLRKTILERPFQEQEDLQKEVDSLNQTLEESLYLKALEIVSYMCPEISSLRMTSQSTYDDEGGYDSSFDDFYIFDSKGNELPDPTGGYLRMYGYIYYDNTTSFRHAYSLKPSYDPKTFVHPTKNLVSEYTPENAENWDKLWTLLTSKEESNRTQGQSLLSALVDGDGKLTDIFANLSSPSLQENYLQKLLYCGKDWWYLFYVTDDFADELFEYIPWDWEYLDLDVKQRLQRPIHSLFLPIIYESMVTLGKDTAHFLTEAEEILGEPLIKSDT